MATKQVFLAGNREADSHVALPITKGLKKGDYLLVYSGEFSELNPERKLVISVYVGRQLQM